MGWQAADLQYYASRAVYTVLTFYQMGPVKVDNRDATLVWRIDMISSERIGELRGIERLGSGAVVVRENSKRTAEPFFATAQRVDVLCVRLLEGPQAIRRAAECL